MKSIDSLKAQVRSLKSSQKEHKRSGLIRALQRQVREQELAVDVLKQFIQQSTPLSRDQVDDMLLRKTVGGPLRFRPKTREELSREINDLSQQLQAAQATIRGLRDKSRPTGRSSPSPSRSPSDGPSLPEIRRREPSDRAEPRLPSSAEARPPAELVRRITQLSEEVEARDDVIRDLQAQIETMDEEVGRLQRFEERAKRLANKFTRAQEMLAAMRRETEVSAGERASLAEEARAEASARAALEGDVAAARAALQEAERRHAAELARAAEEKIGLAREVDSLRDRVQALTEASERGRRDLLDRTRDVGKWEADRARLERSTEEAERRRDAAETEARRLKEQHDELRARIRELEGAERLAQRRSQELLDDRDSLRRTVGDLQARMSDAASRQSSQSEQAAALRQQVQELERAKEETERTLQDMRTEKEKWRIAHQSMAEQLHAAKELHRQERATVAQLRSQLEAKEAGAGGEGGEEVERLQQLVAAREEAVAAANRRVGEMDDLLREAREEASRAREETQRTLLGLEDDLALFRAAAAAARRGETGEGVEEVEGEAPDGTLPASEHPLVFSPVSMAAAERVLNVWANAWAARRSAVVAAVEDLERRLHQKDLLLQATRAALDAARVGVADCRAHSAQRGVTLPVDFDRLESRMAVPNLAQLEQLGIEGEDRKRD